MCYSCSKRERDDNRKDNFLLSRLNFKKTTGGRGMCICRWDNLKKIERTDMGWMYLFRIGGLV